MGAVIWMNRAGCFMGGFGKLLDLLASFVTQVRAAIAVGISVDDTAGKRGADRCQLKHDSLEAPLWGDAPGRITRNGLGSFEIGAGKTGVDE